MELILEVGGKCGLLFVPLLYNLLQMSKLFRFESYMSSMDARQVYPRLVRQKCHLLEWVIGILEWYSMGAIGDNQ